MSAPTPGQGDTGAAPDTTVEVRDNTVSRSYDAIVDGRIAGTIVYERAGSTRIVFTHTIVEPAFRGRGVGTALAKGALDDVRAQGLTLTNYCDFVGHYIQDHPEYRDLIDAQHPGRAADS
jgi:predicted GNAT family acetyltransferase